MIRQPDITPPDTVIDPQPLTTPEPEGRWQGMGVSLLDRLNRVGIEFVRSLDPFYQPPNDQPPIQDAAGPAVGIDFPGQNQSSHSLQFTTLGARAIAAYANLPPEINQALGYLGNLITAGRAASDQFRDCPETTSAMVAGTTLPRRHADTEQNKNPCLCDSVWHKEGTQRENPSDKTLQDTKDKPKKTTRDRRQKPDRTATATLPASQLPNTTLALGALVGLATVDASSASAAKCTKVGTAKKLGRICNRINLPCNGIYCLTNDIRNASNLKPIGGNSGQNFTGQLYGNGKIISRLRNCLVKHLDNGGIHNLIFKKAVINSTSNHNTVGVAACKMTGNNAVVNNTRFINAKVTTSGNHSNAGIAVGMVEKGGMVLNTMAINCNVTTEKPNANAGIGAGVVKDGEVSKTTAKHCIVKIKGNEACAGIGAGQSENSTVSSTTAWKSRVITYNSHSKAGIGVGYNMKKSTVKDTKVGLCTVESEYECPGSKQYCKKAYKTIHLGFAAGKNDQTIKNTQVINSNITYRKNRVKVKKPDVKCNVRIGNKTLKDNPDNECEDLKQKICIKINPKNSSLCRTNNHDANPSLTPKSPLTTLSSNTTSSGPGFTPSATPTLSAATLSSNTPPSGLNFTPSATPTPPVNALSGNISLPGTSLAPFTTPAPPPISFAAIICIALGAGVVLLAGAAVACCCYHRRKKSLTRADNPDWNGRTSPDGSNQFLSEVGSRDWTGPTPPDLTHHHHPLWPVNQAITGNNIPMVTFGIEPDQPMYLNQSDTSEPDQPMYLNQSDTSEPDQPMYLNQSDTSEPDQPMYLNQPTRSRPAPQNVHPPILAEQANMEIWGNNFITNFGEEPDQPMSSESTAFS